MVFNGTRKSQREQVAKAKADVENLLDNDPCNPILVRLAWHDSGTYNKVRVCGR